MSSCLLLLLCCFISNGILLEVNGKSCTEGFMDYSLLQNKARTPSGALRDNRLTEGTATRWIIIEDQDENFMKKDIMFTCATVITEILIGVDIRTVNNNRNLYPKIEVWAPKITLPDRRKMPLPPINEYTRVISVEIRLTPDNFTTNGQYCFTLPTPLNVSSGYRIGVYQPPDDRSVVRFHYMNLPTNIDGTGKIQSDKINDTNIKISGMGRDVDYESSRILIHPIVQNTSCYTQLLLPESIILPYSITNAIFISDTRIFPDIRFTCDGIITNWIVYTSSQYMPVIKIRHSNNLTTTAATLNTTASNAVRITSLLYNFTMSNEIAVQAGDILMIESNSTNYMYYQQYNGPHNYRLVDNNELIALDDNDYPLISVAVEPISVTTTGTPSNYITTSTTSSITTSDTTSLSSVMGPSFSSTSMTRYSTTTTVTAVSTVTTAAVPTDSITTNSITTASISITSSLSTTMTSTPGQGNAGNRASIILIAMISAVIVLLVVTILVILIVSVVLFRKKRKLSIPVSSTRNDSNSNHVYTDVSSTGNDKGRLGAVNNPNYQLHVLYAEAKPALNEHDDMIANASYEPATVRGIESKT
ncbi:PREDICTED: uncharacterized protein LOC109589814 isoform X2 [Amphimedon queenslandica]|uniref:IgGFc-binding protein N-terminal domain-containing protein n=1 Tax=Amphimedon queenslandica TaxID=400682 RepID=A0A1X7T4I8_AMPQE|nr:PREDICTED: uncharacterized protein LOC109589814 isoform X2 [Amphimedon queenslandica]|eukprot:XP_019861380.1 PREDICTED: uncharacterized protein LOC109589814 isoform X2 [Amphimedon queenslandica]